MSEELEAEPIEIDKDETDRDACLHHKTVVRVVLDPVQEFVPRVWHKL